jgi:hypothetical protein
MSAFIAELLQRPHANEVLAEFRFAPETLNEIDVEHAAFIALAHEAIEHSWPCRRDSDALSNGVPTSFPQAPATSCSHEDLRLN